MLVLLPLLLHLIPLLHLLHILLHLLPRLRFTHENPKSQKYLEKAVATYDAALVPKVGGAASKFSFQKP